MRLRKQKEVQKENEFYMQLLQQALPPEQQMLQRQERESEDGKSCLKGDKSLRSLTHSLLIMYFDFKKYTNKTL